MCVCVCVRSLTACCVHALLFYELPQQCWSLYNEYLRCGKKQGIENPKCQQFYTYAKQICPSDTVRKTNRQVQDRLS